MATLEEAAEALSDLRGEIAHFGKPRQWLIKIDISHLVALNRCLDIVIAASLYKELGISDGVITEFQVQWTQMLKRYLTPEAPMFSIVRQKRPEPNVGQAEENSGAQ